MLAANFDSITFFKPHLPAATARARPPFDFGTNDGYEFFWKWVHSAMRKRRYMTEPKSYWDDQATIQRTTTMEVHNIRRTEERENVR